MSEAQHTPGPWIHVFEEDMEPDDLQHGIKADDFYVASVYLSGSNNDNEEAEANARLIAAAPELLDELDSLVRRLARLYPGFETTSARAAIAKAKGE